MGNMSHQVGRTLAAEATKVAAQLNAVAANKAPEEPTHSNARSFGAVAQLLSQLASLMSAQQAETARLHAALDRIANLKVRAAESLLERQDWKALTVELQAIAQDTIGAGGIVSPERAER